METISKYFILADSIALSVLFVTIIILNSFILYTMLIKKVQTRNNVRFCLIVHIIVWYFASFAGLALHLYITVFWRPSYNYNKDVFFILGVAEFASIFAVYVSRFCLTVDCLFVIKQWRNDVLNHFCLVFCFVIMVVIAVFMALMGESDNDQCYTLPCVFGRVHYNVANAFIHAVTLSTFVCSLFCLYLFWKSHKASTNKHGQNILQRILRLSMTLDLHLNVLPQLFVFSLEMLDVDTQSYAGPLYRVLFVCYGVYLNFRFYKCLVQNSAVTPSTTTASHHNHLQRPAIVKTLVLPIR